MKNVQPTLDYITDIRNFCSIKNANVDYQDYMIKWINFVIDPNPITGGPQIVRFHLVRSPVRFSNSTK